MPFKIKRPSSFWPILFVGMAAINVFQKDFGWAFLDAAVAWWMWE